MKLGKFLILTFIFISFSKAEQMSYTSNDFQESTEDKINHDQCFYRPIIVIITPGSFQHGYNSPEQVYHLYCDISQFSGAINQDGIDKNITQTALDNLDNFLYGIKN